MIEKRKPVVGESLYIVRWCRSEGVIYELKTGDAEVLLG